MKAMAWNDGAPLVRGYSHDEDNGAVGSKLDRRDFRVQPDVPSYPLGIKSLRTDYISPGIVSKQAVSQVCISIRIQPSSEAFRTQYHPYLRRDIA